MLTTGPVAAAPLRVAAGLTPTLSRSMERLSSGLRVNRAQDDAAGLSISENLRAQARGANQAARNILEATSIVQIGEEGVAGLLSPLQRIRELAVQAANTVYSAPQLQAIQNEIDSIKQLVVQAYQVAQKANLDLANPSGSRILVFQVGASQGETLTLDYTGLRDTMLRFMTQAFGYQEFYDSPLRGTLAFALGGVAPPPNPAMQALMPKRMDVTQPGGANATIQLIDETLNGAPAMAVPFPLPITAGLLGELAKLGAVHNRLEHSYNAVMAEGQNQAAAESRIRDADMAHEMTAFTRHQLLQRSSLAMVAQANMYYARIQGLVVRPEG